MLFIAKFLNLISFRDLRVFFNAKRGDDLLYLAKEQLTSPHNEWRLEMLMLAPKCDGCKYDAPGQRDHMGPGGCLEQ